jgi:hypothetical protein
MTVLRRVARNDEALFIDEKASLLPKRQVFGIKSCLRLVDDCPNISRVSTNKG